MNKQSYSAEYLRGLPIEIRKKYLRDSIERFIHVILDVARKGETSVTIPLQKDNRGGILVSNLGGVMNMEQHPPSPDELREALLEVFPDCTVVYEEKWIQTSQEKNQGLTVDWS